MAIAEWNGWARSNVENPYWHSSNFITIQHCKPLRSTILTHLGEPTGRDLSTLESSADWFAEQRRILASLEGSAWG